MFTSSQQLQDAKANGRVFAYLAIAGALAGAAIGPVVHFKSLPEAAQQVVTPAYIANFNAARVKAFSNRKWFETRISAYKNAPKIAQKLDQFPVSIAVGAAAGSIGFPLGIALVLAIARSKKKPKSQPAKRSAVTDFLPR
ncbi:hypothetical protein PTW32_09830 [Dechloromonas agitata]|uniref:hypothetical protein n=1 Tax=Dechloromonas agitata TaxID=73030 RepID=UPI00237D9AE9|nr:hypothetical protein [Dechloromonas agitata]MDE1545722.1 hypothetical protein [Dechloromonas agitata]